MSVEEYTKLEALENEFWAKKAQEAIDKGFIGKEKSKNLLQIILNANN